VDTELSLPTVSGVDLAYAQTNAGTPTMMWVNNHCSSGAVEGNVHDVVVPCYNHKLARVNGAMLANSNTGGIGVINGANCVRLTLFQNAGTQTAYNASVSRGAGDDFALFGWLGTVPMINRSTN